MVSSQHKPANLAFTTYHNWILVGQLKERSKNEPPLFSLSMAQSIHRVALQQT
jgi:hypothetical protein